MKTKRINLKSLRIDNFLGIKKADLDLSTPVHIISSNNNQGKSSIRDSLTTLFLGKCPARGYTKKNQVPEMANDSGGNHFSVCVETTEGSTYEMVLKYGSKTVNASKSPIDETLAEIATNPQSILTMKPKDRQDVFSEICQQSGAGDKIQEYLKDWLPEIQDRCKKDLDDAQAWAVEQRIAAKNRIKELEQLQQNAPPDIVTIEGRQFDLTKTKFTIDEISDRIAGHSNKRDELIRLQGKSSEDISSFPELIAAHKEELKELNPDKLKYNYKARQTEHVKAVNARNDIDSVIGELNAEIKVLTAKAIKLAQLGDKCPECKQDINAQHKEMIVKETDLIRDEAADKLEKAEKRKGELSIDMGNSSKAVQDAKAELAEYDSKRAGIEKQIEYLSKEIAYSELANKELEGVDDKIKSCDTAIAANSQLQAALVTYQTHINAVGDIQEQIHERRLRQDEMDKLDQALKPGGDIRKLVTDEIESIQFDNVLMKAWKLDGLAIESDGTIAVNGRPVEALSTSEQYRCGVLLAECLCRSIGVGLLILDGLDILDKKNLRLLFARMTDWSKEFGTILLLLTTAETAKAPEADWLTAWRVDDGYITEVVNNER